MITEYSVIPTTARIVVAKSKRRIWPNRIQDIEQRIECLLLRGIADNQSNIPYCGHDKNLAQRLSRSSSCSGAEYHSATEVHKHERKQASVTERAIGGDGYAEDME